MQTSSMIYIIHIHAMVFITNFCTEVEVLI